jgi:hypothetical protein
VPRLRSSEWLLLAYFSYVALISPFFIAPSKPLALAAAVAAALFGLARQKFPGRDLLRDVLPLALTLARYWASAWFTPFIP